jgi:ABC-2 type transport system permease protein
MRSTPFTPGADAPWLDGLGSMAGAAWLGAARALAAWPVLVGRTLFYLLILVVLSALWDKVAAERITVLAAMLPPHGLAVYIAVTEWVTVSVIMVQLRIEDDVRHSQLEPYLLRPKPYLQQRLAPAMGEMLVRLVVLGGAGLAAMAASGRDLPLPAAWPGLFVMGVLGCAIGTLLYVLVGLLAFWMRQVMPATLIVQKLGFVLGGLLAPISLYPDWLSGFAATTPFAAELYWVGVQALQPSLRLFVIGVGWQLLWIVVLMALSAALWRVGLRKVLREGL